MTSLVKQDVSNGRLTIALNRPELHNALNDTLISEIQQAFDAHLERDDVRMVVVAAEGKSFCAGADLNWMKGLVQASVEDNQRDAVRLSKLLRTIAEYPRPVVARVHGAALGGGMGFVAACDLVAAAPRALFGLTEVRLGLVPAMIFPFLQRKVARNQLLELALTGERFRADRALSLGLVNRVDEDIDAVIDGWAEAFAQNGPEAMAQVKQLFHRVPEQADLSAAVTYTSEVIAKVRVSDEGQEGMLAFLEKRKPKWSGGNP